MVEATLFVPFLIIAVTQVIKMFVPKVNGAWTIIVALVIGVVIAVVDKNIGVTDISVAQGLLLAGMAVGITVTASKAGGGATGDGNTVVTTDPNAPASQKLTAQIKTSPLANGLVFSSHHCELDLTYEIVA